MVVSEAKTLLPRKRRGRQERFWISDKSLSHSSMLPRKTSFLITRMGDAVHLRTASPIVDSCSSENESAR